MTFSAAMRLGSLEILGALVLFGFVASRMRTGESAARPKAVSVSLSVREGASRSAPREVALPVKEEAPAVVGRSSDADLALPDPEVSRRHARFDLVRGVVYLADLGSSNGTFLNGKPLTGDGIELRPGDDIDVGNTRITVLGLEPSI